MYDSPGPLRVSFSLCIQSVTAWVIEHLSECIFISGFAHNEISNGAVVPPLSLVELYPLPFTSPRGFPTPGKDRTFFFFLHHFSHGVRKIGYPPPVQSPGASTCSDQERPGATRSDQERPDNFFWKFSLAICNFLFLV